MTILEALFLGILQGITEFLPVSSSGHLLLFQRIFGHEEYKLTFSIVVHVGTLIPILIIYRERIASIVKNPFQKITYLIILATLPLVIVTLMFGDFVDMMFQGNFLVAGFVLTGIILLASDNISRKKTREKEVGTKNALIIGLVQCLALMPGVSRSGSTIAGGLFCGIDRKEAANFSFLLAIPAILGGLVLEISEVITGSSALDNIFTLPMAIGFFSSMIAGFFAIKIMLRLVVRSKLKIFAYYMFGVAFLILIDQIFMGIVF